MFCTALNEYSLSNRLHRFFLIHLSVKDYILFGFFSQGMDNFGGGMNNMERFGPSGMGRMNGKEINFTLTWNIHVWLVF